MLVVVEGPDGSGKTTLIEQLRNRGDSAYFVTLRPSGPPPSLAHVTRFAHLAGIAAKDETVLCDRFPPISEYVYGKVLRGHSLVTTDYLIRSLHEVTSIVYCRPCLKTLVQNLETERQMAGVAENLLRLRGEYDATMDLISQVVPTLYYDFQQPYPGINDFIYRFIGGTDDFI
ncbi:MAG: hypothetical protein NHG36_02220 [Chromatiaceae bacterium]|nr:hypothetical protein [Candidatus Thioaporhodococcus sediminis]